MAEELKVKVGTKTEKTGKGAKGSPTPQGGDVSGQAIVQQAAVCPYCGAVNYLLVDTEVYNWYECWNCGGIFAA